MNDKLRDALDDIQSQIDNGYILDKTSYEELQVVLEAAWAYWDLLDWGGRRKTIIYHPEVIDPKWFTPEWFGDRCADLLRSRWPGTWPSEFGFEQQFDRTYDADGNPGKYIQVWMRIEDEND